MKKWLSLKILLWLTKIEQKVKVCLMQNKGSVAKMIKVRGNNSMLTSKLHFLSNILAHVDGFSQDFCNSDSFNETIEMRGNKPMLTSKLHVLLNISVPC